MNDPQRFTDPGAGLSGFSTHFVVHCPRCAGRAAVNRDARLTCPACFHTEQPGHWHGAATAYVSVKCRECHNPLRRSAPWHGPWQKLAMHCDQCGDDCEYDAHITRHPFHEGRMTDPVFGLPLWLQKDFRGDLFWAYNHEHLELLRQYIGAKLRERGLLPSGAMRKNSTLVSRLPAFIKKAANRGDLLKLIAQLTNT